MAHKVMILGSMDEFVELVKLAKKRGYETVVCDGYPNGPAKQYADSSYDIDVRNTDEIAILCNEIGVDGIVASFSDLLAECMVAIANKAGLPCYAEPEAFKTLREKSLMKSMFDDLSIPTAHCAEIHKDTIVEDIAEIGFPCVTKPVNGYGSRGVYVLSAVDEIAERFDEIASYSSFDYILAESYCDGYEINMMTWVVDGCVNVISLADREKTKELDYAIPHVSRIVYPSCVTAEAIEEARSIVQRVADYVGIQNGPLSMQFFYHPAEGIKVCEIAGRLFGYEHELATLSSGLSIEKLLLDYLYDYDALRETLSNHSPFMAKTSAGLYFHGYEGVVADVSAAYDFDDDPRVAEVKVYYQPNEMIGHAAGDKPYVARYYLVGDSREELDALTEKMYRNIRVLDAQGRNLLYKNELMRYSL